MWHVCIFCLSVFLHLQKYNACDIFVAIYIKRKIQCDKFIDISFTHFGTLPEEILPARLGVRLLSSTCHISWESPTSQGVAKWQLPMSAKMKPQEEKKQDGSKFHTPKYIKVTPVSIASKRRNRNCSFLQLRVGQWRGRFWGNGVGRCAA